MRKFIVFSDGVRKELTPLTFEEFSKLELWNGANDMAFKAWLYANDLHELDSFNDYALSSANILLISGEREFSFDPQHSGEFSVMHFPITGKTR